MAAPGAAMNVVFSPDSKVFAAGPGTMWDTATGKRIEHFPGYVCPGDSVSFSPDGTTVATGVWFPQLWDPQTGRLLPVV